jgi:hypothetical protein
MKGDVSGSLAVQLYDALASFGSAIYLSDYRYSGTAIAPAAPLTLTALGSFSQISLNWSPAAGGTYPVAAYEIFRATCGTCPTSLVGTVPWTATAFNDFAVASGIEYWYTVRAEDGMGLTGPFSPTAPVAESDRQVLPCCSGDRRHRLRRRRVQRSPQQSARVS